MSYVHASSSNARFDSTMKIVLGVAAQVGPAWLTVAASVGLSLIGLHAIDVGSTTAVHAVTELGPLASKQLVFMGAGLIAAAAMALPHYRWLGYASWVLFGLALGMLVFLLIPFVPTFLVRPRNGARSWIDLGPVDLQPSELVKIAWVMALAWYLRFKKNHRTFMGLLPPAIITGIPVGLIVLQPDLGTACLFIPALFAVLVAAGAKLKHLAAVVLIAALAAPAAYPFLMPHQKARIAGLFLQMKGDESADQDINMQSVTAQRLAGAGGVDGAGQGLSRTLVRYNALPERHNDMVFAVVMNRFGLLGGLGVLGLYVLWAVGALWTAGVCREPFGRLVPVGLAAFVATQVIINVGMNVGLLPIIGITLPFVSHGGSSMLASWMMVGLVWSVALRRPKMTMRKSFEWDESD
ncbi:putative peptidoglycan glycosyltransferase FtsW [Phycisphaerales bacterium]|nr:putative peptidoglycan glycosyltransferase FtsW [Phycisphaerales bacterium]